MFLRPFHHVAIRCLLARICSTYEVQVLNTHRSDTKEVFLKRFSVLELRLEVSLRFAGLLISAFKRRERESWKSEVINLPMSVGRVFKIEVVSWKGDKGAASRGHSQP